MASRLSWTALSSLDVVAGKVETKQRSERSRLGGDRSGAVPMKLDTTRPIIDIAGQKIFHLTALIYIGGSKWLCLCDCAAGRAIVVSTGHLLSGHTKSCGCRKHRVNRIRFRTHGWSKEPEYKAWSRMLMRCHCIQNPDYPRYGGRGIIVYSKWAKDFRTFLRDVGPRPSPRHSLDRIDNDGNYEPSNTRWATPEEQVRNTSHNKFWELDGKRMIHVDWARSLGFTRSTSITRRLNRGWNLREALTAPRGGNRIAS